MPHLIIPQPLQTYRGNTKRFDLNGAIFLPFEIKTFRSFFIFFVPLADSLRWFAGRLKMPDKVNSQREAAHFLTVSLSPQCTPVKVNSLLSGSVRDGP